MERERRNMFEAVRNRWNLLGPAGTCWDPRHRPIGGHDPCERADRCHSSVVRLREGGAGGCVPAV
eukprot:4602340-Alexandrium_andersonii.AAC.1